ncbi:hypothetical protein CKO44_20615 [Rubrivivax gelatinosus]|uniref:hypothetical protein n=1 Tax=Rubrivivax gelatinosus TaxID=28068 RepID=UPI001906FF02|nr:hypothetical protein [Rubrivivax gelatinosus]MBK1615860.1 hypothetical protein [Rubrivivax gelatinosus]
MKSNNTIRPPLLNAWLLWGAVLVLALLAAYVHLLTAAVERAQAQRRPGAAATAGLQAPQTLQASAAVTIPNSHVALIVVP